MRPILLQTMIACLLLSGAALADDEALHPTLAKGLTLDLGIYFPSRELDIVVRGTASTSDENIDLDGALNLGAADEVFATELAWRFENNWSFLAQYFRSSDVATSTLNQDIAWGDFLFQVNSAATAGTELQLTRLFVGRAIDTPYRHDVGFGGGIHWLSLSSFLESTVIVNDVPIVSRASTSAEAPLPNIGAWYRYSFSRRLAFRSRFDLFSANIGDYSGVLINAAAGFNYQLLEHVGIGVSYNYFELDVRVDKSDWQGNFETIYDGAYVYLSAYF